MASGDGAGAFYGTPGFSGDPSEAGHVAAAFPNMPDGTMLRTVDDGVLEANASDGGTSMMYSAAHYDEPGGPHETISAADGMQWYSMAAHADAPSFEPEFGYSGANFPDMAEGTDIRSAGNGVLEARAPDGSSSMMYNSVCYEEPGTAHETVSASDGSQWYSMAAHAKPPQLLPDGGSGYDAPHNEAAAAYNNAQFQSFMPAYEQQITQVNADRAQDGVMEVRHADGSGTTFYDQAQYRAPRGEHQVYEDANGGQWYAIPGKPAVERVPVYEDGKPAYDGDKLRTVQQETIRYKAVPQRHTEPSKRNQHERKPPRRKQ